MDLPGSFVQPFSTFFIFHSKWQMSYIHISLYIIFAVFQSFDHLTHILTMKSRGSLRRFLGHTPGPAEPTAALGAAGVVGGGGEGHATKTIVETCWKPETTQPIPTTLSKLIQAVHCAFPSPSEVPSRTAKLPETPKEKGAETLLSGAEFLVIRWGQGICGWPPQGSESSLRPLDGLDSLEPPLDSAVPGLTQLQWIIICPYLSDLIKYQIFGVSYRSLFILFIFIYLI